MKKRKNQKRVHFTEVDLRTEEQYEYYLMITEGFDFIAGYTENGVPYGIMSDESDEDIMLDSEEELPF